MAENDLVAQASYYRIEADDRLAERFFDAAMQSLQLIGPMSGVGSPRIGELCDVPGLRSSRVAGFRCGWFYFERAGHVDVVRLLAYGQDLELIFDGFDEGDDATDR